MLHSQRGGEIETPHLGS